MLHIQAHLDLTVDDDMTLEEVKMLLATWAQEHDLDMEGSILRLSGPKIEECEYFAVV